MNLTYPIFQEQQQNITSMVTRYCGEAVRMNRRLSIAGISLLVLLALSVFLRYWPYLKDIINRKS